MPSRSKASISGAPLRRYFPGHRKTLRVPGTIGSLRICLMRECDELFAQSERTLDSMSKSNSASKDTVVALARALGEWHAIRGEWEQARNRFSKLPEDGGA